MATCQPVVMYKDTRGIAWNTCEDCERANRKYIKEKASRKAAEYFISNLSGFDLERFIVFKWVNGSRVCEYDYDKVKNRIENLFLDYDKEFVNALEIYYKELGADLES